MKTAFITIIMLISFCAQAGDDSNCSRSFRTRFREKMVGEDQWKNSFSYTEFELSETTAFIREQTKFEFTGFTEKSDKFMKMVDARYGKSVSPEVVKAFGELDSFHFIDGDIYADIQIQIQDGKIRVSIPSVTIKDVARLGATSQGLSTSFAKLFATIRKGIEYRLTKNPGVEKIFIEPSKVVNNKLKRMLENFGFEKVSELPSFGEIRGYREGTSPAAEYSMTITAKRS